MDKKSGKGSQNDQVIQTLATLFCAVLLIAVFLKVMFF
jgi:hypothetical protein